MVESPEQSYPQPNRWGLRARTVLSVLLVVTFGLMLLEVFVLAGKGTGPQQPIPFSHRFHVSERGLSCILCHPGVMTGVRAQIPPLETCMLCHHTVIFHHPQIERLRNFYYTGEAVAWRRLNTVPDFVFFNHSVHFRSGFDCGTCHGDVAGMDRAVQQVTLNMGFCRDCHTKENFSVDCYICHR